MIANYHTHTPRCHHAVGSEEAYVQAALQAGLQTLGFSDHTPYPFPNGFVSSFRMLPQQLGDYADSVRTVQKQYADQIHIHLGVEAEYYPKYFKDMVHLLQDHGIEYMILGQHMLGNEHDEPYLGIASDAASLERYCNQTIEAMHTGLFTYFAHPDMIHFMGSAEVYRAQMRRICRAAKACHLPLEINLLGMKLGRNYPNPLFWELAAEENCDVILGRDAHDPNHLLDSATEQRAMEMVQRFDLHLLDRMQPIDLAHCMW